MFPINKGQLALNVPGHVGRRSFSYAPLKVYETNIEWVWANSEIILNAEVWFSWAENEITEMWYLIKKPGRSDSTYL